MSEQEKKANVVEVEGTVTDVPAKESKIRKWIDSHPKTVKWAKRIGVGTLWLGSTALGYLVGAGTKSGTAEPMSTLTESTTDDEDELEEPAE